MAALPKVLPWDQRAKSVDALPGGYTNHFRSLSKIAARVDETRPTPSELIEWFSPEFNYNPYGTRIIIGFLRRAGLIDIEDGSYSLTSWTRRWLEERDDRLIVALIHSKCRFVGEMLTELSGGRDKEQLLAVARDRYNMNWETTGPLTHRRGWLHSAGLLDSDPEGTWKTTSKGLELASRMELFDPDSRPHAQRRESDDKMGTSTDTGTAEDQVGLVESEDPTDLANEIIDSATDTTDHRRFERAVRDAFKFLGFRAILLGGPGKTDVLLDAQMGRDHSYRVTVDAKTTAAGSLRDSQVDWPTLKEHRDKHEAHHSLLIGPNPTGSRLFQRAEEHGVRVLSAGQLAGIVRQHARAPVGLDVYRYLFEGGGEVDTLDIETANEQTADLMATAAHIVETLANDCPRFDPMTARDLWIRLDDETLADTEEQIESLLAALSNPLIGAIRKPEDGGYVLATSLEVTRRRLVLLGDRLSGTHLEDLD